MIRELAGVLGPGAHPLLAARRLALDFLLGEITRSHADIDRVTWKRHDRRLRDLLAGRGYRLLVSQQPQTQLNFGQGGQEVSVVFLRKERAGRVITHGIEDWRWSREALALRPLHLEGTPVESSPRSNLLEEKLSYERGTGRAPRPKDRASVGRLRALLQRL